MENMNEVEFLITDGIVEGVAFPANSKNLVVTLPEGMREWRNTCRDFFWVAENDDRDIDWTYWQPVSLIVPCISELYIPDSLEVLGEGAFWAHSFRKAVVGNGIKELPNNCFALSNYFSFEKKWYINKSNSFDVYLSDSVSIIREGAFARNYNLRKIRLAAPVENIHELAFTDCYALRKVIVPKALVKDYEEYFYQKPFYKEQFEVVAEEEYDFNTEISEACVSQKTVSVAFDGGVYDYYSLCDVELGDKVCVSGKMHDFQGEVVRVKSLQQLMNATERVYFAEKNAAMSIEFTEKEQKKAKEKILTAAQAKKKTLFKIFRDNIKFGLYNDEEVFRAVLECDGGLIQYGDENIVSNRDLMKLALQNTTDNLFLSIKHFNDDKELALMQIEKDFSTILCLSDRLQKDEDIRAAAAEFGAEKSFLEDVYGVDSITYEVVKGFVKKKGYNLGDFSDFVDDVELLKIAVMNSKELLSCSWVPAWVKADAEICYYAVVKGNILQLEYVSSTLKSNAIFVAAVLSAKPNASKYFTATQIQSASALGKIPEKKFFEMIKN